MHHTMGGLPVDLATWQRETDEMIRAMPGGYWPPLANLARLTEEVGELARALNQRAGPKRRKTGESEEDLALEMGDVLFTLAALANQFDVDLGRAAGDVLDKYRRRDGSGAREPVSNAERDGPSAEGSGVPTLDTGFGQK